MRRPLCVFCIGMLGVELVCAFLPQTESFLPFAAFFMAVCLVFCLFDRTRKPALCILLGTLAGLAAVCHTNRTLEQNRVRYAGRKLVLTAEVETVSDSYRQGCVDAVLRVETANGTETAFRIECENLPECEAGERIRGVFVLSPPETEERISCYADGIALCAELQQDFSVLGKSQSFRARTRRLQKRLSASLRRRMDGATGGVLAAMTVGDRNYLSADLRSAYRGAGLSHVLVVSGMHVSILCGDLFAALLPRRRRERSYRSRRFEAVCSAILALLLVGVTGFTPSVRRAAAAVWISALGVWVYGAPDPFTSLAAAGIAMTIRNSYAVCDIGFELSFAAVLGTLAGAEVFRRIRSAARQQKRTKQQKYRQPGILRRRAAGFAWSLCETLCIAFCASAATFPVLVLRGLSVSLYAVVSSMAVLWMVQPMLLLGLGAAFTGSIPALEPVYGVVSQAASFLTRWFNAWAVWISTKPGASLYFDTWYAAAVCLLLFVLCGLALHWKVRLRAALPCLLLVAAAAIGMGNALTRDVIHIDLVGSAGNPAIVVTQNRTAVVLFRGGAANQRAVENQLARRGVTTVELLEDLRLNPQTACTLPAKTVYRTAALPEGSTSTRHCTAADVETRRTRSGCLVRLTIGGQEFVTLSGTVQLEQPLQTQWLMASTANPASIRWEHLLSKSSRYHWMQGGEERVSSLEIRPDGTWRAA